MTWAPVVTVTIAGTDYTGDTVDFIRLTRGRNTVYTSVQPAVASITLLDKTGAGIVPTVADSVVVTLEDSAGSPVTLFVGEVSDWSTAIYDAGIMNTAAAAIRVTAVSNLAKFYRRQVFFNGRSVEKDGDRVLATLLDGLAIKWEDATGSWNSYTTETWETFEPFLDFSIIDTPGLFDVSALTPNDGGYNAGSTATSAGLSTNGLLYETADGRIGYADGQRRRTNTLNGYLAIPSNILTASQITTGSQLADLANEVVVIYGGGETVRTDQASIDTYGKLNQSLNTVLANLGDAENFGDDYLANHSQPTIQFESAEMRLDQNLNSTLLDNLINCEINDPIEINALPATLGITTFAGFVEGVLFNIDPYRASLQLFVSSANLSLGPIFWAAFPSIAWEDVDSTLQWSQAGVL